MELKKAFDTVDHQILLSKLNYYGIHGKSFEWFQSYVENHPASSWFQFLAFGNPMKPSHSFLKYYLSNCKPRMYADDTHLTYAGSNLENV